jgi:hypothetical protein
VICFFICFYVVVVVVDDDDVVDLFSRQFADVDASNLIESALANMLNLVDAGLFVCLFVLQT